MTEELSPRIIVFGVGGAGGNAVDNMIEANLQGVEFVVANTDAQALNRTKTDKRIQLGPDVTRGLGAGARPDVGAEAAEESIEEIVSYLEDAHMVFIAAGMGGGTGTGAAPVIARAAHDRGILTVGVVTKPFGFEGARRMQIAQSGLEQIRESVDTLIVVPNQNLFRIANERTTFADAFRLADDVLYSGVRGITDLMVMPGLINLDFADVRSIMTGMGSAMMGMGEAEGDQRALEAARAAIDNPLLDDVTMEGARGVLINITGGYDMTLFELDEAANEIRAKVADNANIILGSTFDHELEGKLRVSVVAAGLEEGKRRSHPVPVMPQTGATGRDSERHALVATGDTGQEQPGAVGETGPVVVTGSWHTGEAAPRAGHPDADADADQPTVSQPSIPQPGSSQHGGQAPEGIEDMLEPVDAAEPAVPLGNMDDMPLPTIVTSSDAASGNADGEHPAGTAAGPAGPPDTTIGLTPTEPDADGSRPTSAPVGHSYEEDEADAPQSALGHGFGALFGWRRDTNVGNKGAANESPVRQATEAAASDDADLQIPSFLRRSANH